MAAHGVIVATAASYYGLPHMGQSHFPRALPPQPSFKMEAEVPHI